MAKKHKSATQVTLIQEEKSTFSAWVHRNALRMGLLALVVVAVVLWRQYQKEQASASQREQWGRLYQVQQSADPEQMLHAAESTLAGTGLGVWAALGSIGPFASEGNYKLAKEAAALISNSGQPLLTALELPLGPDGEQVTVARHLQAAIESQEIQAEELQSIFENPPPPEGSPRVELVIEIDGNQQTVTLGLYAEEAPRHVENFLKLVQEGYYDGIKFHRIIKGFMVQAGDPNTKDPEQDTTTWGQGGPDYKIEPETGDLVHARYCLAAAKGNEPQSSGSQFYIATGAPHHLDGRHTVFGAVLEGTAAIDELEQVPIRPSDGQVSIPEEPVPYIVSMKVLED